MEILGSDIVYIYIHHPLLTFTNLKLSIQSKTNRIRGLGVLPDGHRLSWVVLQSKAKCPARSNADWRRGEAGRSA